MRNSLIIRDPFREFDALVRRSFGPAAFAHAVPVEEAFVPTAEAYRNGDDAVIRLELPGVDIEKDVNVEVVGRRLVISGERRDQRSSEAQGRRFSEVRYGSFRRSFRLGPQVTAEHVTASYDAGVLTVRVAGAYAAAEGQRIAITTGEPASADESTESTQG